MADTQVSGTEIKTEPAVSQTPTAGGTTADAGKASSYAFGGKTYNSVDDLGKAYESLQSEHGKWTQQYGDLKKQYDDITHRAKRWDDWWETVKPLWGDDIESLLKQKMTGRGQPNQQAVQQAMQAGQQNQQNQGQDWFEGYDLLSPRDQAVKLGQALSQQLTGHFTRQVADLAKAVNDTLVQKEQWYQSYFNNHLGLLRKAIEQKLRDPNFDIDKTMEMAAQAIGGQIDPIQLGRQLIDAQSFQNQLDSAKKTSYEQGKKDFEQEMANKKQEAVPATSFTSPKYKVPITPAGTRKGLASMRESVAEDIVKKFGPGWFTG